MPEKEEGFHVGKFPVAAMTLLADARIVIGGP
jgi:hypothetical protein